LAIRGIALSTLSSNFGLSFDAQPPAFTWLVSFCENSFDADTFVYNHRATEMVERVELIQPGDAGFDAALKTILGREPDHVLTPALPYSVIVRNNDSRAIALLGIRFDLIGLKGKYSVVHYADTLRHPEKTDFGPGVLRFVCAEPSYTDMVLRGARAVPPRGRMNLENLFTALQARASLDCVAFADGQFSGRDSLGAFERFAREREAENSFLEELAQANGAIETMLQAAMEIPAQQARDRALIARRTLARRLHDGFTAGGLNEVAARVQCHRVRIGLWR
jgi:hypothetical protein